MGRVGTSIGIVWTAKTAGLRDVSMHYGLDLLTRNPQEYCGEQPARGQSEVCARQQVPRF